MNTEKIRGLVLKIVNCDARHFHRSACTEMKKLANELLSLLPPPCSECGGSGEVPQSCDKCEFQRPNGCGVATTCPLIPCLACQAPNVMDYTVPKGFLLVKSDSFMGKIYDDFIKWLEKKDKQKEKEE